MPFMSPTSCEVKLLGQKQSLELPLSDATEQQFSFDGTNAVVAAQEAKSDSIHVTFYALDDNEKWRHTELIVEEYMDLDTTDLWYHYFLVLLVGKTALLGLPLKDTSTGGPGVGKVYVYEQIGDFNIWEKTGELLPQDSSPDTYFGCNVKLLNGYAYVAAFSAKAIYDFRKNELGQWVQKSNLGLIIRCIFFLLEMRSF